MSRNIFLEDLKYVLLHPGEMLSIKKIKEFRDKIKFYTALEGIFLKQEYRPLYSIIRPDTTLLDLGAFTGDTAIYFAMHPNVKNVISVEPEHFTYEKLKKHISDSGFAGKIKTLRKAVYDKKTKLGMRWEFPTGNNYTIEGKGEIETITLPELIRMSKGKIAIKCDIEGDESRIFDTDLSRVYAMQIEYHGKYPRQLVKKLKSKGFTISKGGNNGLKHILSYRKKP